MNGGSVANEGKTKGRGWVKLAVILVTAFCILILVTESADFGMSPASSQGQELKKNATVACAEMAATEPPIAATAQTTDRIICETLERPRNLHLVFVGDSVTRYQYLSLAYYLSWGRWFDPSQMTPHLVNERSFLGGEHYNVSSWNQFFRETNRMLAPYEKICDCFRPDGSIMRRLNKVVENRYWFDDERNNSLTYILAFGTASDLHGRYDGLPTLIKQKEPQTMDQSLSQPFKWTYSDWTDLVRLHLAKLKPKPEYAVFNVGLWEHRFATDNNTEHIALTKSLKENQMHGIFKTTTPWKGGNYKDRARKVDQIMCSAFEECLNISWTERLHPKWYWDGTHFVEPVYRIFNEQLLNQIGHLPDSRGSCYSRMNMSYLISS